MRNKGEVKLSKENQLIISDRNQFKTVMLFHVIEMENEYEYEQQVGCNEDMEEFMKLYFDKNWKEFFMDTYVDHRKVCDVGFNGLLIVAKNEMGVVRYQMDRSERLAVTFNHEVLGDENATKIKKIREIIG
ncbi:hypothetical protein [Ectobacillus antri]|uniref:hypothetical protein n=1 Tax=Ectobacillus antri TaxID=2486280 RepID=UPI000F5A265D|nr:hypothetical protein [Ectobacillus antri]